MDFFVEAQLTLRIIFAAIAGAFIGWERESHGREAGMRTYATVAVGACVFGLISSHMDVSSNPQVIAGGVVTGIGFLCAGVILRKEERIAGLTTAATIWSTASVGLSFAYGCYLIGLVTTLLIFLFLSIHHFPAYQKLKKNKCAKH